MQLLGRAKFLMEDENPKGKVKFLKGVNFLGILPPGRAIFLGISHLLGGEIVGGGGEIPGTPGISLMMIL